LPDRKHKNIRELLISICSFFLPTVSQSQLAVSNKKPKFGPRVATQAWWIERIKEDPIYQYTEEWAKHSEYQVARWKILAELDYKVLGTSILRGAPGLGQAYPRWRHTPSKDRTTRLIWEARQDLAYQDKL